MELLAGFEPANIGFAIRRLGPDLATVAYKMQDNEALTMSCGAHIDLYTAPLPEEDTVVLRAWPSVRLMVRPGRFELPVSRLKVACFTI